MLAWFQCCRNRGKKNEVEVIVKPEISNNSIAESSLSDINDDDDREGQKKGWQSPKAPLDVSVNRVLEEEAMTTDGQFITVKDFCVRVGV